MSESMFLSLGRVVAGIALVACLVCIPCAANAASSQPIVWSRECPTGGEHAEQLYQRAIDYQKGRNGTIGGYDKAVVFFEAAVREGSAKAALAYGMALVREAHANDADWAMRYLAEDLFALAMNMQCPEAGHMLAETLESDFDDFFIVRARIQSLYTEAADKGSLVSMVARAKIDKDDAEYWLTKALNKGYGYAGEPLADLYLNRHDTQKALAALRQGAALGSADCLFSLWMIYDTGRYGQEKDPAYAEKILALYTMIDQAYEPQSIPEFDTRIPPKPVLPYREREE